MNPGPSVYKTDALPLSYRGYAESVFGVSKVKKAFPAPPGVTPRLETLRLADGVLAMWIGASGPFSLPSKAWERQARHQTTSDQAEQVAESWALTPRVIIYFAQPHCNRGYFLF